MEMGRYSKLLQILCGTSDANIAFDDLRQLLLHLGFQERTGGSHYMLRKQGITEKINLQCDGSNEDDAFVAEVPQLPGCVAHGSSQEAALVQAQEAI